jgi:hypothetical protein
MNKTINVSKLVTAIRSEGKATGDVTKEVQALYSGCTTAEQFRERRIAVNAAIDAKFSDKETAKGYRNRTNAVLIKYIVKPLGLVLTNRGTKKRGKGSKAAETAKVPATKSSKVTQPATLQSMTATDMVAAVVAFIGSKPKADAIAIRDRITAAMTTTINSLK